MRTFEQQNTPCKHHFRWEVLVHIPKARLERRDCQQISCAVPRNIVERVELRRYDRNGNANDVHVESVEYSAETERCGDDEEAP